VSEASAQPGAAVRRGRSPWRAVAVGVAGLVILAGPLLTSTFYIRLGVFALAVAVGAIGLNLLVGVTGQLSLAHAFFVAVGAYSYIVLASPHGRTFDTELYGLHLPPIVAMAGAVVIAGVAGLLFSPIASRVRGIYLGVASIGLVFLGLHLYENLAKISGGSNGRDVPVFTLPGLRFADPRGPVHRFLGHHFIGIDRLWYLMLVLTVASWWFARNILASRPGRALQAVREGEVAASVVGVNVRRYKGYAFLLSSMYAGLAGVMIALSNGHLVPQTFDFGLSVQFLAMIVIGGLGSMGGSVIGAVLVSALPSVLSKYSDRIPGLAQTGTGGIDAGVASNFLYGAAVIALVLFEPGGLAAIGRRFRRRPSGTSLPLGEDDLDGVSSTPSSPNPNLEETKA
jgi:branched-chain amino acid transport system permease protein